LFKSCKKRKLEEINVQTSSSKKLNNQETNREIISFDSCLIGSSMIKHIDKCNLLEQTQFKKTYFKSISGGLIKNVLQNLKEMESELFNCKLFVITVGSNDCDSLNQIDKVIADYFDLIEYLRETYSSETVFVLNKLIPRLKTRYTKLDEFNKRRLCFNNFIQDSLSVINSSSSPFCIVEHERFEDENSLNDLLSDGVHLSVQKGVGFYVEDIKNVLNKLIL
jgi:hypothetical protein